MEYELKKLNVAKIVYTEEQAAKLIAQGFELIRESAENEAVPVNINITMNEPPADPEALADMITNQVAEAFGAVTAEPKPRKTAIAKKAAEKQAEGEKQDEPITEQEASKERDNNEPPKVE